MFELLVCLEKVQNTFAFEIFAFAHVQVLESFDALALGKLVHEILCQSTFFLVHLATHLVGVRVIGHSRYRLKLMLPLHVPDTFSDHAAVFVAAGFL